MKRLIVLSLGIGLIGLAGLLLIRGVPGGAPVQAQEATSPPSNPVLSGTLSPAQAQQLWRDAEQLAAQGQPVAGADLYMRIAIAGPNPDVSLRAALRAGHSYRAGNQPDKAMAAYEAVERVVASQAWPDENDNTMVSMYRSKAVCNRADLMEKAGKPEEAAQLCGSLVREVTDAGQTLSTISYSQAADTIEVASIAAKCLERANKPAEALWYYDAIVSIADAKGYEDAPENSQAASGIQNLAAPALCDKANACVRAGRPQEALDAVRKMRTEFPDRPGAAEMGLLEAQLTGANVQQAERLSARDSEASDLLKQFSQAAPGQPPAVDALQSLDTVINSYPGTPAVLRALESKGQLLKDLGRPADAEPAFVALMEQLGGEAAFRSRIYQTARIQLADTRLRRLRASVHQHQPVSDQDWDNLQALCSDIMARGLSLANRAYAHKTLGRSYACQGRQYMEQNRYDEAASAYQQALQAAGTDREKAEVLGDRVTAIGEKITDLRRRGQPEAAKALVEQARPLAVQAAAYCLAQALGDATAGIADYAPEQAALGFKALGLHDQALATAEQFVSELTKADAAPVKIAIAQYVRARALCWNKRFAEAREAAVAVDKQYASHTGEDLKVIRADALAVAALYTTWAGNPQEGLAFLDELESRKPPQPVIDAIAGYRRMIVLHLPAPSTAPASEGGAK